MNSKIDQTFIDKFGRNGSDITQDLPQNTVCFQRSSSRKESGGGDSGGGVVTVRPRSFSGHPRNSPSTPIEEDVQPQHTRRLIGRLSCRMEQDNRKQMVGYGDHLREVV